MMNNFGNKRGVGQLLPLLLVGVVVALVWMLAMGNLNLGGGQPAAVSTLAAAPAGGGAALSLYGGGNKLSFSGSPGGVPPSQVCSSTTSPQAVWQLYDKNNGNSITGSINYKINDGAVSTIAAGTALTALKVGDRIDFIAGGGGGANAEYNVSGVYIVECTESATLNIPMQRMSTAPTVSVINDDGTTLNAVGATQAVAANDERSVEYKVRSEARRALEGLFLIVEYNTTLWRSPLSTKPTADVPGFYAVNDSDSRAVAFYVGDNLMGTETEDKQFVTLRSSATNPGAQTNVETCLKDSSFYIDELDGRKFRYGASDENQVVLGQSCAAGRLVRIYTS